MPDGIAISIRGRTPHLRLCTLVMKYLSMASVMSKSAITPFLSGRITEMLLGAFSSMDFATIPTALPFKRTLFVNSKTVEVFETIARTGENVYVIGDNIYGEIKIGNQMNFITVLVKQGKFSSLLPIMKDHRPKYTINDIRELKELLKNNE